MFFVRTLMCTNYACCPVANITLKFRKQSCSVNFTFVAFDILLLFFSSIALLSHIYCRHFRSLSYGLFALGFMLTVVFSMKRGQLIMFSSNGLTTWFLRACTHGSSDPGFTLAVLLTYELEMCYVSLFNCPKFFACSPLATVSFESSRGY